jgi:prephenate dehydrogenase
LPPRFVLVHPIADCEQSGVKVPLAHLFAEHKVTLIPTAETDPAANSMVLRMWDATSAAVQTLGIERHNLVFASTSHFPHLLAYSLVDTIAENEGIEQKFLLVAGGFRDFSRITSGYPVEWRDICLKNKDARLN